MTPITRDLTAEEWAFLQATMADSAARARAARRENRRVVLALLTGAAIAAVLAMAFDMALLP